FAVLRNGRDPAQGVVEGPVAAAGRAAGARVGDEGLAALGIEAALDEAGGAGIAAVALAGQDRAPEGVVIGFLDGGAGALGQAPVVGRDAELGAAHLDEGARGGR